MLLCFTRCRNVPNHVSAMSNVVRRPAKATRGIAIRYGDNAIRHPTMRYDGRQCDTTLDILKRYVVRRVDNFGTICRDVIWECRPSYRNVAMSYRNVAMSYRIVVCRVLHLSDTRRATLWYDARQCDTTGDNAIRHSTFSNDMSRCRIALLWVAYASGARRRHYDKTLRQCDTTLDILKRHCRDVISHCRNVAVDRCSLKYIPVLTHISSGELLQ